MHWKRNSVIPEKNSVTTHHEIQHCSQKVGIFHVERSHEPHMCTHASVGIVAYMVVSPSISVSALWRWELIPWDPHSPCVPAGFGNTSHRAASRCSWWRPQSLFPWRPGGLCVEVWHPYQDGKWNPGTQGWKWISCTAEPSTSNYPARCFFTWSWQPWLEKEPEFGLISILKSLMECWGCAIP